MENAAGTWQLLVLGMLALIVALLMVVLALTARRRSANPARLESLLEDRLEELQNAMAQQGMGQREEQMRVLQSIGDSLAKLINRGTDVQRQQLTTFQQHEYEHDQSQEQHAMQMYRLTQESLGKFETRMQAIEATLDTRLRQNEERVERLRATMDGSMAELRKDNAAQLNQMRLTVDEKLTETLDKRLSSSFSQVSERLEQVYKSLGEVHKLAEGVGDLKRVLGNVKKRGIWGEIQLGSLLAEALTSSQYAVNVAVRPGVDERVEYAVCLPGKTDERPVYLPIDSKFPQEDFARLSDASERGDAAATDAARKALINAVKVEAKRIAGKYIEPPYTTDFAIMFLPLESLYAEVVRDAETIELLQREQRVVIAGPSTLLAMLNSLQMGFRTLAIERRSAEVWKLLGAVKTDFGSFSSILQKTQEKLRQATDTIDTAFVRTRSIERKLRRVEALDDDEAQSLLEEPILPAEPADEE